MTPLEDGQAETWAALEAKGIDRSQVAVVVVDHGSRIAESNAMLIEVVQMFEQQAGYAIVEPAHMELAEPSIDTAFARCVERGARLVIVHPYFLLPGRHWTQDIPALSAAAAKRHAGLQFLVTPPLGLHPLMPRIMQDRITQCVTDSLAGSTAEDVR